jgi:hypothetical protein
VKLPAALSSAPKSMPGFVKKELPVENAREVTAKTLSSTTSSTTPSASTYSYPSGTLTDKTMPTPPVSEFLDAMDKDISSGATMEMTKTKALYKVSPLQQWGQLRPSSFTELTGTNFGSYARANHLSLADSQNRRAHQYSDATVSTRKRMEAGNQRERD